MRKKQPWLLLMLWRINIFGSVVLVADGKYMMGILAFIFNLMSILSKSIHDAEN